MTARFTLQAYALTVTPAGTGTGTVRSTPGGLTCGTTCTASFPYGTLATLTATPATGSLFTGWSGGVCTGTGACTVTVTQAASVTATFELQTYALTVAKAGTGTGTVTSTPAGLACDPTCSALYPYGTAVTLTATPDPTSTFTGWSGGLSRDRPLYRLPHRRPDGDGAVHPPSLRAHGDPGGDRHGHGPGRRPAASPVGPPARRASPTGPSSP